MEQVKHDTAIGYNGKRYTSPKAWVVFVKAQGVLCGSPSGENTEGFTLGDNVYRESDWV